MNVKRKKYVHQRVAAFARICKVHIDVCATLDIIIQMMISLNVKVRHRLCIAMWNYYVELDLCITWNDFVELDLYLVF